MSQNHDHNHDHNHTHGHVHSSSQNIGIAFFLNFFFTIIEIIGGIWTNSLAILSDAVHDLGDSFSLGLAWFLDKYSQKGADETYTFGYSRFSLLGALINTIILIIGSILVLSRAIPRLIHPEASNAKGVFVFAIVGIIVNGIAAYRLHGGNSINEKVVSWHMIEDLLGWVAVLIASSILLFKDIYILDPILSIAITLFIIYNVIKNLINIFKVLLQRVPEDVSITEIEDKINSVDGIIGAHHTHVWSLDGQHNFLSTHLVIEDNTSKEDQILLKKEVKEKLSTNDIDHITLELEFCNEECESKGCDF